MIQISTKEEEEDYGLRLTLGSNSALPARISNAVGLFIDPGDCNEHGRVTFT